MPVILLANELQKHITVKILFIGIQVRSVSFGIDELSVEVEEAVDSLGEFFSNLIIQNHN